MFKRIVKFKVASFIFLASFILILGGTLWAYFALRGIAQPLILHFNDLVGINQTGGVADLLQIGATGIVFVLINFFLTLELEERNVFLGKLLAAATLFLSILIFIGFAVIISVN